MKQKLLALGVVFLTFAQLVQAQIANHVVISEVYGGGGNSGAKYTHDFIELYNPTRSDIVMTNWSVQYTSATGPGGNTPRWGATTFSGTIKAGSYFLIQQAMGTGGTVALPTPDVTGSLAMAGTAGKVILSNNNEVFTIPNPTSSAIVDVVGFGSTANFYEGSGPTTTLTNSTSAQRASGENDMDEIVLETGAGNGWDSNDNSIDFKVGEPTPKNSASPAEFSNSPAISFTPGNLNFGNIFINSDSPERKLLLRFVNLGSADVLVNANGPFTISKTPGGPYTSSVTITDAERTSSGFNLYVASQVSATGAVTGTILLTHADVSSSTTINLSANGVETLATTTKISTIQGTGNQATAGTFQVEAVVTGVYGTLEPAGFYIQEEDDDADGNDNTSEGIFVVMNDPTVRVGDLVRVLGTVQENGGSPSFNQAVITSPAVSVLSSNNPAPSFTLLDIQDNTAASAEKYEGMRVQFASELLVSDVRSLAQYGEVSLSMGGSIYTATQIVDPNDDPASGTSSDGGSNVAAVNAYIAANAAKVIVLDDGSGVSNPTTIPYLDPVLNTVTVNSTISSLKGIMGYGFAKYRIQPLTGNDVPVFTVTRPAAPTFTKAGLKIAAFNVLNYFNGDGSGSDSGFRTSEQRGATSAAAFAIQRSKIIKALAQMNADVVGLLEIENDGTGPLSAVQDLVNGLNSEMTLNAQNGYAIVEDGNPKQTNNGDAIKCAIIYKQSSVSTPAGHSALLTGIAEQRPFLAQTFETVVSTEPGARALAPERFVFIVNHFKSKGSGSSASGLDLDQNDGQSFWNATRKTQASALLAFIDDLKTSEGTDRIVTVGDYNAYYEEDPMDVLREGGLVVPSTATDYSYHFDGALGALDHALFSSEMAPYVEVKKWHINSTEPAFLQYTNTTYTDANSPFRSSDHDPLLINVDFSAPLPVRLISFNAKKANDQVLVEWKTAEESNNSHFTVQRSADASSFEDIAVIDGKKDSNTLQNYRFVDVAPLNGLSYYRLKQTDLDGASTNSRIVTVQMNGASDLEFTVYPNPVTNHISLKFAGKATTQSSFQYQILNKDGVGLFSGKGSVAEISRQANAALPILKPGMYVIKVTGSTEYYSFKFLKQ
jgi:predicted extracellular nuclease